MRVPRYARPGEVGFNMTPMIDVVFLLIIFFLVSSHLAKQEVHLELPLPTADSGEAAPEDDAQRVTINVLADGRLLLAGKPVAPEDLQRRLSEQRSAAGSDLEVRIRSDRSAAYQRVEPILLSAARAGVWNVTFSVYREEDVR
ncbi:MAG: biopolymer transporter ExbD [Planctomycetes bacterium]|nr:biopolymer transporter ExbD [Planctomycetota bacterium]